MFYQWTGGTTGQTVVDKYYKKYYASFFGLFKLWSYGTTDELIKNIGSDIQNVRVTTRSASTGNDMLPTGDFIKLWNDEHLSMIGPRGVEYDGISIYSIVHNVGNTVKGKVNASEMSYTNWAHTKGYVTYNWTETQGNYVSTTYTLNGSNRFSVSLPIPDGDINIRSGAGVYFRENVETATNKTHPLVPNYVKKGVGSIAVTADGIIKTMEGARLITDERTNWKPQASPLMSSMGQ